MDAAANAGPLGAIASRTYDDGYVKLAPFTGDPAAFDPNATWNWGYQQNSQISAGNLLFHSSGTTDGGMTQTASSQNLNSSGRDDSAGPYLQFDLLIPLTSRLRVGPQFSFAFGSIDTFQGGSNFAASQQRTSADQLLTDSYDLMGVIAPGAPYAGTFAGPGPVISNLPTSRSVTQTALTGSQGSQTAFYSNDINRRFNADIYTFTLGVNVEFDLTEKAFVFASAGVALRVANFEATQDETLFVSRNGGARQQFQRWHDTTSGTAALWGGFVQGGVGVRLTKRISVNGFVRYNWSQELSGAVGPSAFRFDSSGPSAGAFVAFSF